MQFKRYYRAAVREAARPLFGFFEWLGVHVTPVHFYQPIPDTKTLPPDLWDHRSSLVGLEMRDGEQLSLLETLAERYKAEYDSFRRDADSDPAQFHLRNGSFESVDAEIYYAMLRHLKPRQVIEVGSGNSTLVAAEALRKNAEEGDRACEYTVIDPFPRPVARKLPEVSRVIEQPIEDVPMDVFESLGVDDVLFIDSSHVVRIGGDVVYEYLEILPRLKPGVVVHIHDIFLPSEYPKRLMERDRWFWSEQYLLQAFLAFNSAFEIICANAYLALNYPDAVSRAVGSHEPGVMPGSFWMRRV